MHHVYTLGPDDHGRRLDRIVRKLLNEHSLGEVYALFRKKRIKLNGERAVQHTRGQTGDKLSIVDLELPDPPLTLHNQSALRSSGDNRADSPLTQLIVYESQDLLILNKPRGVTAHGEHSLIPSILSYLAPNRASSLSFTPGPVHRLDRNTTGLIAYAKTVQGARRFSALLRGRSVRKSYLALLRGNLSREQLWRDHLQRNSDTHTTKLWEPDNPTGGEALLAETLVTPLCQTAQASLALLEPRTGRTHQLRAQAALHGHPLLGDSKYDTGHEHQGESVPYILHAAALSWKELEPLRVVAPLPDQAYRSLSARFGSEQLDRILHDVGLE